MIAAIVADEGYESAYGIGYFGLTPLTGVTYDPSHGGKWWTAWWGKNKSRFNEGVRGLSVPVLKAAPKPDPATYVPDDPDVADIPTTNYYADTAKNMRYIVSGPVPNAPAPAGGWKLMVVLPGGDGSVDFHPFLKRVLRGAMPRDFLLVQLVAKKWSADQFDKIVWPTKSNPWKGMEFSTEEFIEAAITDVKKHYNVDASHIYGMGWSSSGPPLYAHMMSGSKSFAGTFIAMSVFWPDSLPKVDHIKGYPVYILHSPQDFIQMSHPENAVKALTEAGAKVKFETYQGGHGWHGDTFGMIRAAFEWLQDPK
jgi:predicted esterase